MWTPRFTTGTCKTLLSAVGVWIDSKNILIDEVFDFDYEGTMKVLLHVQCESMSPKKTKMTHWLASLGVSHRPMNR